MTAHQSDYQVGGVSGFRLFRLRANGVLDSYSAAYRWSPGRNEATCRAGNRPGHGAVPALGCGCGFWMYKDLERCARMFRAELADEPPGSRRSWFGKFEPQNDAVLGKCLGWGRVLEGEDGWRTEYAALDALVDIAQGLDLGASAARYDVPTVAVPIDLALVRTGTLSARDEQVGPTNRIGIEVDGRRLEVSTDARAFIDLWRMALGTTVKISLDPKSGEVASVRAVRRPSPAR